MSRSYRNLVRRAYKQRKRARKLGLGEVLLDLEPLDTSERSVWLVEPLQTTLVTFFRTILTRHKDAIYNGFLAPKVSYQSAITGWISSYVIVDDPPVKNLLTPSPKSIRFIP